MTRSRHGWACAAATGLAIAAGAAHAQDAPSGEVRIWSWDVAAKALAAVVPAFNERYPNVKVTIEDLGNQPTYDRGLAACAAGGSGMPDIYQVENQESEVFWARFPDCFRDIKAAAPAQAELLARFPAFKLTDLTVGDKVYAMPWDSGPVVVYYRRDMFEKAGVDANAIATWDDFVEAGKKVVAANGEGVKLASSNADTSWFRMIANQAGCAYFDEAGETVTINQPGCVAAMETVGKIAQAGLFQSANWGETLQAINGDKLAAALYGGWYEGSLRSAAPGQSGKWGVMPMPALQSGGYRAANLGGSALAIPQTSQNPEAALAFVNFALGTAEGQIIQLKESGLVPTLPEAVDDPYVKQPQPYWGGQPIWETVIGTLPKIKPARGTQYFAEADNVFLAAYSDFLAGNGEAKAVLDGAAEEISGATGLPIKE